jgi:dihydrolipoamide dehydrogenase
VGVEFASIFRRFGSEVTIIELLPRLVPVEDEAVSAELEKSFKKQGIKSLTGTKVTKATVTAKGVDIEAQGGDGKTQALSAELLLVATGRGPVTTGLGAEELGLVMEKGYLKVDNLYRTSVPNVSAIGDVITFGRGPHRGEGEITRLRRARWHVPLRGARACEDGERDGGLRQDRR